MKWIFCLLLLAVNGVMAGDSSRQISAQYAACCLWQNSLKELEDTWKENPEYVHSLTRTAMQGLADAIRGEGPRFDIKLAAEKGIALLDDIFSQLAREWEGVDAAEFMEKLAQTEENAVRLSQGGLCRAFHAEGIEDKDFELSGQCRFLSGSYFWNENEICKSPLQFFSTLQPDEVPPGVFWVFWIPSEKLTPEEIKKMGSRVHPCAVSLVTPERVPDEVWERCLQSSNTRCHFDVSRYCALEDLNVIFYFVGYGTKSSLEILPDDPALVEQELEKLMQEGAGLLETMERIPALKEEYFDSLGEEDDFDEQDSLPPWFIDR